MSNNLDEANRVIEQIKANRKPVLEIDKRTISYLTKEIQKNNKSYNELKAKTVQLADGSKEKIETDNIIAGLEKALAKMTKDLEYYKSTPVPKYKFKHLPKEEIDSRVQNAARILNLAPYLDR